MLPLQSILETYRSASHQVTAQTWSVLGFNSTERGQHITACGTSKTSKTSKTSIALWIA